MEQFLPSKLMNIYIANVIPMHSFEFVFLYSCDS